MHKMYTIGYAEIKLSKKMISTKQQPLSPAKAVNMEVGSVQNVVRKLQFTEEASMTGGLKEKLPAAYSVPKNKENLLPNSPAKSKPQLMFHDDAQLSNDKEKTDKVKLTAEEELQLRKLQEEELERQRKHEEKLRKAKEKQEKEETDLRLKRLAKLLKESEFFSSSIAKKIEEQQKPIPKRQGRKSKTEQLLKDKALLDARDAGGEASPEEKEGKDKSESIGTKLTSMGIEVSIKQPYLLEGGCMRDYQIKGFEWMKVLADNGVGGILADEMGLGKTIQTIALICSMIEKKAKGPFLVIAPLSTLANWISEFSNFAPRVPVVMFHGNLKERTDMVKELTKIHTVKCDSFVTKTLPVVVTSYEIAWMDKSLQKIKNWDIVVLDEGHRIKNMECRTGREVRNIRSKCRLLLTGTPLQNNLKELWSLLNYLVPDVFADLSAFEDWFKVRDLCEEYGDKTEANNRIVEMEKNNQVIAKLHKILKPFMLRRTKADVELGLPPKREILVFTPMTAMQKELYELILHKKIHAHLLEEKRNKVTIDLNDDLPIACRLRDRQLTKGYNFDKMSFEEFEVMYNANLKSHEVESKSTMSSFMVNCIKLGKITSINPSAAKVDLRKVVNHPYLIQMPLIPGTKEPLIDEDLIQSAGKMLVLDAMLAKLKERGHKVLIFSQWTSVLDCIEDFMLMKHHTYCRLDGTTAVSDRVERIAKFNTDPSIFAFLLTTRAGGLGINLTSADTVIIYDSDWNPQCDIQAQDRCHRIGQTKPVVVYRLTADGTIDRRMLERATGKRRLEKIIMQKGQFTGKGKSFDLKGEFSPEELLKLLNSQDFSSKVQSNGYVFTDEELDKLLDRSDMMGQSMPVSPVKKKSKMFSPDAEKKEIFKMVE
ncbi:lymphocyte-specific helicase-like [Neocloeon triangulifer]|uniref:lymphocyte-specific helicase-like n=1 Tax=Neocloeon triangulifer TaxID=2078957 RepID=UPI00286EF006|nr:lymphocyte-specific helicase-like [Neocloeon triangulifer]